MSGAAPAKRWFDLSGHGGLATVVEEAARRCRSNTFLTLTDRGRLVRELTFQGFQGEVQALAAAMADAGVGVETRVAILMANGPEWLIGAAAVIHLGGVLVPLDARLDAEEQARLLEHSGAEALLVDGPTWRRLSKAALPALGTVVVSEPLPGDLGSGVPWEAFVDGAGEPPAAAERTRSDLASIVYSSGTSGRPKGCLLSHGNYLSQVETLSNLYPMEEDDVYLSILPTNHALDFMCGFLVPLLCGARVVHLRTLRPEWVTGALKDHRVTHMSAVPALLDALARKLTERLDALEPLPAAGVRGLRRLNRWLTRDRPNHAISRTLLAPVHEKLGGRLRRIFAGGAFVPPATARTLYDLGLPVAIGYGLTEASAVVSVNDLAPFRADSVGPAVPGTELKLEPRDASGRGEVWVRGPQVFSGYLDDPELTRETLVDGWLRTGDLGEIDATGHLRLVGRLKHMIVTAGGKNVYPEDVEARFHGLDVEELAVLASHTVWPSRPGEDESLVLVLRPRGEPEALLAEVARRNRRLPAHQRVTGALLVERSFPRTTSLKLKRAELAAELADCDRASLRSAT